MIIIRMSGGLGNQMFQYAFYQKLLRLGREVSFDDVTEYSADREGADVVGNTRPIALPVFGLTYPRCAAQERIRLTDADPGLFSKVRRKITGRRSQEKHDDDFIYDPSFLEREEGYFTGCFQSPLYFQGVEEEVQKAFTFPENILDEGQPEGCAGITPLTRKEASRNRFYRDAILRGNRSGHTCAIHLRFGDYLDKSDVYGGIATKAYYQTAISYLSARVPLLTFFVFSNDTARAMEFVAEQTFPERFVVVSGNDEAHGYADLYLMQLCENFIICNSSFSFWGAWLGQRNARASEKRPRQSITEKIHHKLTDADDILIFNPPLQEGSGKFRENSGNLQEGSGNFRQDSGNLQEGSGNFRQDSGNLQEDSGNFRQDSGNFQKSFGTFQKDSGSFREGSENFQKGSRNLLESSVNFTGIVIAPTYWINESDGSQLRRLDIFPPDWVRINPSGVCLDEPLPLVSVIVAAYNIENYIGRALASLEQQTLSNMEFIVVDDGSTDQTGAVCDAFAARDSRFRVIHKPNGGLSDARNAGLSQARGQWIGYLDGDDAAKPQMFETMLTAAVLADADMAICAYTEVAGETTRPAAATVDELIPGNEADSPQAPYAPYAYEAQDERRTEIQAEVQAEGQAEIQAERQAEVQAEGQAQVQVDAKEYHAGQPNPAQPYQQQSCEAQQYERQTWNNTQNTTACLQAIRSSTVMTREQALQVYVRSGVDDEGSAQDGPLQGIHFYNSVWSKLFSRKIVEDLRFPVGHNSEDILYTTKALTASDKVVYLPTPLYEYTADRSGSIMNQKKGERRLRDEIPFYEEQIRWFSDCGMEQLREKATFYLARRLLFYWEDFDTDSRLAPAEEAKVMQKYADQLRDKLLEHKEELQPIIREALYARRGDRKRLELFLQSPALYRKACSIYRRLSAEREGK